MSMFAVGIAKHSMHSKDPILHILVNSSGDFRKWNTWCGGGPASIENTLTQRRCTKCLVLARNDLLENKVKDNEPSELDWYLMRQLSESDE